MSNTELIRHDWTVDQIVELFNLPFSELIYRAATVHRQFFEPDQVQVSTLLSIKTGACPEDCKYCPQSAHYKTGLEVERLLELQTVVDKAKQAKAAGATRFCMGAAWRQPRDKDLDRVIDMVTEVRKLGMETCVTLGMLEAQQAQRLKEAGLDYYNHNIDTSEEYYSEVISTRKFDDRLQTLENVRQAGLNVCCGGIVGMGESVDDRASMLKTLANLPTHPQSVPINQLVRVAGTPYEDEKEVEALDMVRTIAVARIVLPKSMVRLSAGRSEMSDETQALCFLAGANSVFYGERLLTTDNPDEHHDQQLFKKLGVKPMPAHSGAA
ncbi:MAG: biotin synthase [Lysobacteraceae bacterium]|nr:MAG: biotin synthase [Xanthomonadaceae bacterium]